MQGQTSNCWNCGGRVAMEVCLSCGHHIHDDPLVGLELGGYRIISHARTEPDAILYGVEEVGGPHEARVLRLLPRALWSSQAARERFVEAGRRYAGIDSPNVARCLGHGSDAAGPVWHVIEWLAGVDLAAVVRRGRTMPLECDRVVAMGVQMAAGLKALHQAGVAHGRICPTAFRNLSTFSDASDWVQLEHVGSAAIAGVGALQVSPAWVGGEAWSAFQPEHEPVSFALDVFGVGAIMAQLLLGRSLPRTSTPEETLATLIQKRPPLKELVGLQQLIERALAGSPRDRFADGAALLDAVQRVADNPRRPLVGRPERPMAKAAGRARKEGSEGARVARPALQREGRGVSSGTAVPARPAPASPSPQVAPPRSESAHVAAPDPTWERPLAVLREMLSPMTETFLEWARRQDRREALRPRSFGEAPAVSGSGPEEVVFGGSGSRPAEGSQTPAPQPGPPAPRSVARSWVAVVVASPFLKVHGRRLSREARMESSLEPLERAARQVVRTRDGLITYLLDPEQNSATAVGRVLSFLMEFERTQRVAAPAVAFVCIVLPQGEHDTATLLGELVARAERLVQRARGGEVVATLELVRMANIESVFSPMPRSRQMPEDGELRVWSFAARPA